MTNTQLVLLTIAALLVIVGFNGAPVMLMGIVIWFDEPRAPFERTGA